MAEYEWYLSDLNKVTNTKTAAHALIIESARISVNSIVAARKTALAITDSDKIIPYIFL